MQQQSEPQEPTVYASQPEYPPTIPAFPYSDTYPPTEYAPTPTTPSEPRQPHDPYFAPPPLPVRVPPPPPDVVREKRGKANCIAVIIVLVLICTMCIIGVLVGEALIHP